MTTPETQMGKETEKDGNYYFRLVVWIEAFMDEFLIKYTRGEVGPQDIEDLLKFFARNQEIIAANQTQIITESSTRSRINMLLFLARAINLQRRLIRMSNP